MTQNFPISFTTLACPDWDWQTILREAQKMAYTGLEMRGIQAQMDLTACEVFSKANIQQSKRELRDHNLRIVGLGASTHLHEEEPIKRHAHLDEARRYIDLAQELEVNFVRVFPNHLPEDESRGAALERIISGLQELGSYARSGKVNILLETHGNVTDTSTLLEIMQGANLPNVGMIWDINHMYIAHQEPAAEIYQTLKAYIQHVHIKDCVREENGIQYVLLGEGIIPLQESIQTLVSGGYSGFYSLEWEKRWHPKLDAPEIALPQAIGKIRQYLEQAGL